MENPQARPKLTLPRLLIYRWAHYPSARFFCFRSCAIVKLRPKTLWLCLRTNSIARQRSAGDNLPHGQRRSPYCDIRSGAPISLGAGFGPFWPLPPNHCSFSLFDEISFVIHASRWRDSGLRPIVLPWLAQMVKAGNLETEPSPLACGKRILPGVV